MVLLMSSWGRTEGRIGSCRCFRGGRNIISAVGSPSLYLPVGMGRETQSRTEVRPRLCVVREPELGFANGAFRQTLAGHAHVTWK